MLPDLRRTAERPGWWGIAALLLTVAVLLSHYALKYGLNTPPAVSGDELSYDTIGWNLATGHGFAEGGDDPDFYRLYDEAASGALPSRPELVAHRPPLFPLLLSFLNRTLGRQFWGVRTLNVLATAGTCALLVWYLAKANSRFAALAGFVLFLVVDTRTRLYGRAILTEATSTFLFTVLTVLLLLLSKHPRRRTVLLAGLTAGLLVLDRSVFALWLPGLAGIVCWLSARGPTVSDEGGARRSWQAGLTGAGLFLLVAVVVVLPWSIRNVRVLNALMPLGTQGMSQLPSGFSDHALERQGVWDMEPTHRLRQQVDALYDTRLQRDTARARLGRQEAMAWIRANPTAAVRLGTMKIAQEYRPRAPAEWLIICWATLGCLISLNRRDTHVFLALHALSCLVIAATWSVEGRFVMPLMFITHIWSARIIALPFGSADAD